MRAIMIAFLSCLVASARMQVHASEITYSNTLILPAPHLSSTWGYALWPQFDPAAGILRSVSYDVAGAVTFTVAHDAPSSADVLAMLSRGLTLNGTGLTPRSVVDDFDQVINWTSFAILAPGDTVAATFPISIHRVPELGLAPFIGKGSINALLTVSEDSDACVSTDLRRTAFSPLCRDTGTVVARVTYVYEAVPEPASALLLGLSLFAMAPMRRR